MAYWHLGIYAQALADSDAALKLEPDNAQAARLKELGDRKDEDVNGRTESVYRYGISLLPDSAY